MLRFTRLGSTTLYASSGGDPSGDHGQLLFLLPKATPRPAASMTLDQTWAFQHRSLGAGYYLFLQNGQSVPTADANRVRAFADRLHSLVPRVVSGQSASLGWVTGDPSTPAGVQLQTLDFVKVSSGRTTSIVSKNLPQTLRFQQYELTVSPATPFARAAGETGFNLSNAGTSAPPSRGSRTPTPTGSKIYFAGAAAQPLDKVGTSVFFPLAGSGRGSLQFSLSGLNQADIEPGVLDTALYYVVPEPSLERDQSLRFPLLDLAGSVGDSTATPTATIAARLYPANHEDSLLGFDPGTPQVLRSFFRTERGEVVYLAPGADAGFRFTHVPNPGVYPSRGAQLLTFYGLTPVGNYELVLANPGGAYARLLGGQSGTEYISFQARQNGTPGDYLAFFHGQKGYASDFAGLQTLQSGLDLLDGTYTTSWVTVGSGNGHLPQYYAQPDDAALHGQSEGGGVYLEYVEVPAANLEDPQPGNSFPLVPLAGVIAPDARISPPIGADKYKIFEEKILNPTRKERISGFSIGPTSFPNGRSLQQTVRKTTTPQGMLVDVLGADWQTLTMAFDGFVNMQFSDISAEFQDALQSNRLFLVASKENTLADAGAFTANQVEVTEWPFELNVGVNPPGTPTTGIHRLNNILIFKFMDQTFEDLAADTRLWANPGAFNDQPNDVQTWLQEYIADAKAKAEDAETQALYEPLVNNVLMNPNWTGILALNVDVPAEDMPCAVQGLMGGIRKQTEFKAHHLGFEISKVSADASTIEKSSIFALIDYEDSDPPTGGDPIPDFEFIVSTLKVRFANTEIADFSSTISLVVKKAFDETVKDPIVIPGSGGKVTIDTLELEGSYQVYNGIPTYTFELIAVHNPMEFAGTNDRLSLLHQMTVTKIQFASESCVDSTADLTTATVSAKFSIWGNVNFRSMPAFDFFSFDKLVFTDLAITMTFGFDANGVPERPDPYGGFVFDPGNLRFSISASKARSSSLLSAFPLKLSNFHYATGGLDVSELGYLEIPNLVPGWGGVDPDKDGAGLPYKPKYALAFTLDIGPLSSQSAKKKPKGAIEIIAAWWPTGEGDGAIFGVKLGAGSDGKKEIGLEGVLVLAVDNFGFMKIPENPAPADPFVYAFFIKSAYLKIVNTQVPPGGDFSLMLFVPYDDSDTVNLSNLGWFVAYNRSGGSSTGDLNNPSPIDAQVVSVTPSPLNPAIDAIVTIRVKVKNASTAIRPADSIAVSVQAESVDPTTTRPLPPAPPRISKAIAIGQESGTEDYVFTWPAKQPGTYTFTATATVPGDLAPGNSTGESGVVTVSSAGKSEKRSIVKLDYLAVGQRVQLAPGDLEPRLLNTVESVLDVMRTELVPTQTGTALREQLEKVYNPDGGLLIGVDVTILEVVRIAFVFAQSNELYGALIGFVDKAPKFLKGFQFQILYKKITDDIGVYQMVLTLPDFLRQFELGAASITLPIIGIDIYTNGDFKLDFGFPRNADFSRSFSIQMMAGPIPILGYAGFYFNKLSGATSTLVPVFSTTSLAKWDPVLEFGIGLKLGIGKTIEKGPLKAGVSIAIQVILEGALAWYQHPSVAESTLGEPPDWYRVKGQAGLVAQLYGIVDFGIIKIGIEVNASANFLFVYESYKDIELGVILNVSVRVSVVIGSFKIFGKKIEISISFSFSATFSFEFTVANPQGLIAPWNDELANPLAAPVAARSLSALQQAELNPIAWNAGTLVHGDTNKKDLVLTFAPQVTIAQDGGTQRAHAVAGLTIASGEGGHFNDLLRSVISWAVYLHKGTADSSVSLTVADLQTLDSRLHIPRTLATTDDGNSAPLDYAEIRAFMLANFNKISVAAMKTLEEDETESAFATVFPMLPEFTMVISGQNGAAQPSIDFAHHNPRNDDYEKDVAAYFNELLVDVEYKSGIFVDGNANVLSHDPEDGVSMATIVVQDYFAFLIKTGIDRALESAVKYATADPDVENSVPAITLSALLTKMDDDDDLDTIGKMAARFFFHGLRLPPAFDDDDLIALSESALPLYQLTGQQVPIRLTNEEGEGDDATPAEDWSIALALNTGADDLIDLGAAELTIATDDDESRANVTTLETLTPATGTVTVAQLDRLASRPREFSFKNPIHVEQADTRVGTLYPLSDVLISRLSTRGAMSVTPVNRITDVDGNVTDADMSSSSKWALRVNFTAKRIARSIDGTGTLLSNTYLVGGTSEGARNLIGRLLESTPSYSDLRLYYELEGKTDALVTDGLSADADVVLMKTNLSTVSAPQSGGELMSHHPAADDFSAAMTTDQASSFLRLIWEASITNAPGYYMYYNNGASSGETGIPEESFGGGSNQANLTLVVTFTGLNDACDTLLMDTANVDDGELLAIAAGELSWHPAIAPGAVAFEVTRPNPQHVDSKSTDEIAAALEPMFNLLSYYVDGDTSFGDSIHGLPVGPTSDDLGEAETPENWTYRQGIKVYPYALPVSSAPNLYAGTGNDITIGFEFLDIFGNEMPGTSIPALVASVYYSDPLKGVGQWPSVTSGYVFEADGGAATLKMTLHFTAENYTTSIGDASRVVSALEMYRQIQEQIDDANVSATLTTSLATTLAHNVLEDLRAFVDDIITYLENPADTASEALPIDKVIEVGVTSDQPDNTFAVVVEVAIDRPEAMVDPQALTLGDDGQPRMPEARRVVTPIAPQSTSGIRALPEDPTARIPDSDQGMALTAFAEAFEEAFPQFKVATGLGADGPETIWAIRMGGSGMTVQIDGTPVYFAPAPLSNVLMQRDAVPVRTSFPTDTTTATPFANVDMDVWGREFLEAVDRFLTADLAVTARKVNSGEYLKIIQAKETLAAAAALGVTHVLNPEPSDAAFVDAAREAYQQSLLTRLSTAYEVETAVVYSATTTNSYPADTAAPAIAPRLYGNVIGTPIAGTAGETRADFSLSNTKIALDNSTGPKFVFLFKSERTENQASSNVDISYNVTHVEHDIQVAVDGYEASSWLTLLLPEDPIDVGPTDIPIALREFPVPPALVRQQALPEDISNATTLERATFWEYLYTYEQQTVAQDSIFANVQFNVGPEISNLRLQATDPDLFDWLARFNVEYPLLSDNLDLLVKGNAELAGAERDAASAAVAWFANLVEGVAGSWGAWVTQAGATRQMLQSLEGYEWDFEIIELFNANEVVIQMALTDESAANAEFPDVEVTLEDGTKSLIQPTLNGDIREYRYPWSAAELPETRERTFIFDELDVLNTENGWGGIHLERNLNLTSDLATPRITNPRFVYQTPEVRFVNKVTPLIDNKTPINISPSGGSKTLNAHLSDMLVELFEQAGEDDTRDRLMKVGCRYNYDVRGQSGPAEGPGQLDEFQAYMPLLQRMTFTINPNGTADFVNGIVDSINQWMSDVNPSRARGFYEFDMTVFSALSNTDLPVLRLRRLWLGLDRIS